MNKVTRTIRIATCTVLSINSSNNLEPHTFHLSFTNKKTLIKEAKEMLTRNYPYLEYIKISAIHRIFDATVEMPVADFYCLGTVVSEKEVNALEAQLYLNHARPE